MAASDCPALPKGWKREEIIRKNGLSSGKIDVFYYSPSGKRFRSKPQLARFLGDAVDLSTFDYRTGKINSLLLRKSKRQRGTQFDYNRGIRNDASLVPPIRQTASIFKQPVTVVRSTDGKVRTDFKHGPQDKPKQLFWEKRLQGLKASDMDEEAFNNFELPRNMKGVGPDLSEETLLRSIATALHVSGQPIVGQTNSRVALDKNPSVYINPEQPLVQLKVGAQMDSNIMRNARLIDIIDSVDEKLPKEHIAVPARELPDPEPDNGNPQETLREQEQKWTDLALHKISLSNPAQ